MALKHSLGSKPLKLIPQDKTIYIVTLEMGVIYMETVVKKTKKQLRLLSVRIPRFSEKKQHYKESLKLGKKEWDNILSNVPIFL